MPMISSSTEELQLRNEASSAALVTRDQGATILKLARERLREGKPLRVDLTGVEAISPSFVDEFFGGLFEELGEADFRLRVRIDCPSAPWRTLIRKVLSKRRERPKGLPLALSATRDLS